MKDELKVLFKTVKKDMIDGIKKINWFKQLQLFLIFTFTFLGTLFIFEHKSEFLELTYLQSTFLIINFVLSYILIYVIIKTISLIFEFVTDGLIELYDEYKENKKEDKHLK